MIFFFFAFLLQQIVINLINSHLPAGLIGDIEIFPEEGTGMELQEGKGGDFGQNPGIWNEESSSKLRMVSAIKR